MYTNKQYNVFQSKKVPTPPTVGFSLDSTLFPEIISNSKIVATTLNYKNSLLVPESIVVAIPIVYKEKTAIQLKLEQTKSVNKIINSMNDRWIIFRLNYIEMYGEDEYEKWYIPLQDWEEKEYSSSDESELELSDEEDYEY